MEVHRLRIGKSPFNLYLETTVRLGIIPVRCLWPENHYTLNQRTHVLCQKKIPHRARPSLGSDQRDPRQTALISTGKTVEQTQSGSGFTDEENISVPSGNQSPVMQLAIRHFTV